MLPPRRSFIEERASGSVERRRSLGVGLMRVIGERETLVLGRLWCCNRVLCRHSRKSANVPFSLAV